MVFLGPVLRMLLLGHSSPPPAGSLALEGGVEPLGQLCPPLTRAGSPMAPLLKDHLDHLLKCRFQRPFPNLVGHHLWGGVGPRIQQGEAVGVPVHTNIQGLPSATG